jgi:resuscitation-promoting factor RpfB
VPLIALLVVAATVGAAYLVKMRPWSQGSSGAVAAMAAVPTSHTMALLEQRRTELIAMSAASRTLSLVGQPRLASRQPANPAAAPGGGAAGGSSAAAGPPAAPPNPGTAQSIAFNMMGAFGFPPQTYFSCLNNIWNRESGWVYNAQNPSGAYGIPQALPGSKMASAGADWATDPATQIRWGLGYIKSTYGNPCSAWAFWEGHGYY